MSTHKATVTWIRETDDFSLATYNRSHEWDYGDNNKTLASAAPGFAGDAERVDPEQAFTVSLSSCHMLTFLALASQAGFTVNEYIDEAEGVLAKHPNGGMWVSEVNLKPSIVFGGGVVPSKDQINDLHHKAHEQCFIAKSIKTHVTIHAV